MDEPRRYRTDAPDRHAPADAPAGDGEVDDGDEATGEPGDGEEPEPELSETEPETEALEAEPEPEPEAEPETDPEPESRGSEPESEPESGPAEPGRVRRAALAVGGWLGRERRRRPGVRIALFALVGAVVAVILFGRVPAKVGPFETTLSARPSLNGHTVVHLAPLGTIDVDTHDWPLTLDLRLNEISLADAERIADNPASIERLGDDAPDEVRDALVGLAVRCVIAALVGGVVGALAAQLSWRAAAGGAGVASLVLATLGLGAAATFDAEAVAEPRYTGLLTRAPAAVGDMEDVLDRFGEYRAQLSDLVDNMATLYLAGTELPTFEPGTEMIRVLHVSDIHLNPQAFDMIERLTEQFRIDAVADTGDLTDWGTTAEAQVVARIGDLDVPYVYVRGNHDSRRIQEAVAAEPNAVVLDGEGATVAGLRFWGIGDPRYTPDKSEDIGDTEQERAEAYAPVVADRLAEDDEPADVVMVHDERMAGDLGGEVPLVLAGHTHEPAEETIEPPDEAEDEDGGDTGSPDGGSDTDADADSDDTDSTAADAADGEDTEPPQETLLLVEGSTGGAGLRGLQGDDEPEPLTASVLYFDPETRLLVAYDHISVDWLQEAGATIERHIIGDAAADGAEEDPAS